MSSSEKKKHVTPVTREEVTSETQLFLPDNGTGVQSVDDVLSELINPAYSYKNPMSSYEGLVLRFQKKTLELTSLTNTYLFQNPNNSTPPKWQWIVNYLYGEGVLRTSRVSFDPLFNDEPKIYSTRLWGKSPIGLTDGGTGLMSGGYSRGVSLDPEEAFSKVIGEFLERYPLTLYKNQDLIRASINDLQKRKVRFLNPFLVASIGALQKEQNPKYKFDEHSVFRWIKGRSLTEDKDALLPAQMVFWNYRFSSDEPIIHQPITNGAGGMFTEEEAILSGLYELIQRDAFFINWFNYLSPPKVDISFSRDVEIQTLFKSCKRYNLEVFILDTTCDLNVPTYIAILIDRTGKGPALAVGGGGGPDENKAIIRALTEAIGVRLWLRKQNRKYSLPLDYKPFSTYISQSDRLLLWENPESLDKIKFFLQGDVRKPLDGSVSHVKSNPEEELSVLVEFMRKKGSEYAVFFYKAKHKILDDLSYHSVQVSVPALLPLYFNETAAPLGSNRIIEACKSMGKVPSKKINEFPHPFP